MHAIAASDPLTLPTWLTAIFTGVLALFAIVTAVFAWLAFRKQSAELVALTSQASDQRETNAKLVTAAELQAEELRQSLAERKRQGDERRRAQAEQVFMWVDRPGEMVHDIPADASRQIAVHVKNASAQPIQVVMFIWYRGHSFWGPMDTVPYLMPGDEHSVSRPLPDDLSENVNLRTFGAAVFFKDRANVLWRIKQDGSLAEVPPDEPPDVASLQD